MTIIGGSIENKEIGLKIGVSGTYSNVEKDSVTGFLRLKQIDIDATGKPIYADEGSWISDIINLEDKFLDFGKVFADNINSGSSSIAVLTRVSDNRLDYWSDWTPVAMDGTIQSEKKQYIQVKINLFAGFATDVYLVSNFDNADYVSLFTPNNFIETSNGLRLKRDYNFDMTLDNSWANEGSLHRKAIVRNEWEKIDKLKIKETGEKVFLDKSNSYGITLSENNLRAVFNGNITNKIRATSGKTEGKHYCEFEIIDGACVAVGVIHESVNLTNTQNVFSDILGIYPYGSTLLPNTGAYNFGTTIGTTISMLVDLDNGTLEFWRDGVSTGVSHTNLNSSQKPLYAIISTGNAGTNDIRANFGGNPFKYNMPSDYTPYEKVVSNKTLILYEGEYKKFNDETPPMRWDSVSSVLPSSERFLLDGMDSISPLLDRKLTELEPLPMTDKSEILSSAETGKVFGKTINLNKYLDIRNMKVEVK